MTMSLVHRRLILLTLILLFLATAISDTNPVLAGKKVKSLSSDLEISAGSSVEATVKINKPAPSKGAVVYLASADDSLAKVPESVFVRPGESSAMFVIDTAQTTTDSSISISATYGSASPKRLGVKIKGVTPPAISLSTLTVAPTTVQGGAQAQGTVTISSPAPSGGIAVALTSGNPSFVTIPASLSIPAGESRASFTIGTNPVSITQTVSVSATYAGVKKTALFNLSADFATLSSISLNPNSVTAGSSSQGTVTLSAPAGFAGAVVPLSSNSAAAAVPASVTVPAGASSAAFTVTTGSVSVPTSVTISASYGSATRTAPLTVTPLVSASLSSVVLNPATLVGGNSSQGTVVLSSGAPSGGAVVTLSDNDSSASLPASVTVAAGATSATFTVTTTSVTSARSVTVSAVYSGVTRTALLTVNPVAATLSTVALNPTSVVGGNSSQGTVTLTNGAPSGGAVVTLSDNDSSASLPASVTVAAGATSATFTVNTTSVTSSRSVTVSAVYSGVTRTASLTVNPVAAALSTVALNPTSVVGGGSSQGTVTLTNGAPSGGAVVTLSDNDSSASLPASVTVAAGATSATFTVTTTSVTSSRSVTVSAVYSGVTRTASLTVNPVAAALSTLSLNPTTVVGGNSSQATVTLTSGAPSGGAVVLLSSNNSAATVPTSVTVAAGATSATFTINTTSVTSSRSVIISTLYSSVTREATLSVNAVPAALSAVTVNPATVVGGNPSQGTVTLTSGAPSGGAVVSLSSNNSAATVPTSVSVAAGATSATFTINTTSVTSSRSVTISALYSSVTRTASLTVNPVAAALSAVSLNPTAVVGGASSQGTVTLTAPAPTGGAIVSLSSNNSAATVPTTVTVNEGSTSRVFTVNTTSVTSTRTVTISAVYSGVTRTASLFVDPVAPALTSLVLNPTTVIGGTGTTGTVTLNAAAPPGGSVVSLSSSNTLVATVLPSVLVSGGATTATFPVVTLVVLTTSPVTITGNCGGGTSGSSLTVQPLAADSTPPLISAVTVSGISSSGATISWTTNEPSNTQIDYGTTTSYGSSTPLNSTLVTAHTATLSGLSANTLYNYRVKSRDGAGNLATSSNFSFTTSSATVPGCPGFVIEGFGRNATGGCGGVSLVVDTLSNVDDSTATTAAGLLASKGADGRISFKEALLVSGARIITFNVSGNINLGGGWIELENGSLNYDNLTIDGSTAPNQGVQIVGGTISIRCNNVIIRYMRFRSGNMGTTSIDCLRIDGGRNVVIDHSSVQWGDDGDLDIVGGSADVTVQWSIMGENLGSGHNLIKYSGTTRVTMHHNLYTQGARNPQLEGGDTDFVNNVIYRNYASHYLENMSIITPRTGAIRVNFVGNYYKGGALEGMLSNRKQMYLYGYNPSCDPTRECVPSALASSSSAYFMSNIAPTRNTDTMSQTAFVWFEDGGFPVVTSRHSFPQVTTSTALQAYNDVLAGAGATLPCRDSADSRMVNDVRNGTGIPISDPSEVGGFPNLNAPCGGSSAAVSAPPTLLRSAAVSAVLPLPATHSYGLVAVDSVNLFKPASRQRTLKNKSTSLFGSIPTGMSSDPPRQGAF